MLTEKTIPQQWLGLILFHMICWYVDVDYFVHSCVWILDNKLEQEHEDQLTYLDSCPDESGLRNPASSTVHEYCKIYCTPEIAHRQFYITCCLINDRYHITNSCSVNWLWSSLCILIRRMVLGGAFLFYDKANFTQSKQRWMNVFF